MKVQPSFKGVLSNRYLLSGLKKISEHGTSFVAVTSFVMSSGIRTFSILNTPGVEKENKHYAAANSIGSGLVKFGIVEAVALPLENIIKKIDKNPEKYLKETAVKSYMNGAKQFCESRSYRFVTQIIKQSAGLVTAIPKSLLTVLLIPLIKDGFFPQQQKIRFKKDKIDSVSADRQPASKHPSSRHPSFKHSLPEFFAKQTGKLLSREDVQKFAQKYCVHDKDISKHMTAATDILLTTASAIGIAQSEKIKENRKRPLIFNNIISTAATLLFGYGIDSAAKRGTDKFIEKFSRINKNDINLPKYIEGINILRPTLIFALIYYGLLPVFSTFMAERAAKKSEKI